MSPYIEARAQRNLAIWATSQWLEGGQPTIGMGIFPEVAKSIRTPKPCLFGWRLHNGDLELGVLAFCPSRTLIAAFSRKQSEPIFNAFEYWREHASGYARLRLSRPGCPGPVSILESAFSERAAPRLANAIIDPSATWRMTSQKAVPMIDEEDLWPSAPFEDHSHAGREIVWPVT